MGRRKTKKPKTCGWCGVEFMPDRPEARCCSRKCSARLREVEKPSPGRKREYPQEIIDKVLGAYRSGMTMKECQQLIGPGIKAEVVIYRYIKPEERHPAAKRDQTGEKNDSWKGDEAGYAASHLRVVSIHGIAKDHLCTDCQGPAHDWSYIGGAPDELICRRNGCRYSPSPDYYAPRCRSCHRRYDAELRATYEPIPKGE